MQCKERARVGLGRGEDQTEHINTSIRGGRHCNRGDIDARGIISERAARVGKGQDKLLARCGLDEAAKEEENTAELRTSGEKRIEIEIERLRKKSGHHNIND
jgi:hypothetical protein